jgi:uncharacterized damage-inducible protein DinB
MSVLQVVEQNQPFVIVASVIVSFLRSRSQRGRRSALRRVSSNGVFVDIKGFLRMFAYDYWANRECLAAMRAAGSVSPDTVGRMAHILSAQKLWLERILKQRQSMPVWPGSTIEDCMALADEMSSAWRSYLMQFKSQLGTQLPPGSLDDQVEYRNSKGEPWSSRAEDVLTHVLFHSAYHRGQIALQMRASGLEPAYTDFIHAVRQGFVD